MSVFCSLSYPAHAPYYIVICALSASNTLFLVFHKQHDFREKKPLLDIIYVFCRSQWLRGLRCRSTAARLLRSWVRIPPGTWMFVCCECCVLSGRGLCDELIARPEESYRVWCIIVCDPETSRMRRPLAGAPRGGGSVLNFVTNFCETFLFLRQIGQVVIVNVHKSSFKAGLLVILVGF